MFGIRAIHKYPYEIDLNACRMHADLFSIPNSNCEFGGMIKFPSHTNVYT